MVAVPDEFMDAVVFLCVDQEYEGAIRREPGGTGFFVRKRIEGFNLSLDYVVTARHNVEKARLHGKLWIRMNLKNGTFYEAETNPDDWYVHASADVAAITMKPDTLPIAIARGDLKAGSLTAADFVGPGPEYAFYKPSMMPTPIRPRTGHEIFFIGLFTENYGEEHNLPIARFGHIARMPGPVKLEKGAEVIAYLAEFHSWGGHSGSPVFFLYPYVVNVANQQQSLDHIEFMHISGFMGLITGHYDIPQEGRNTGDILGKVQTDLNSGIAIVTPAVAVLQLLDAEDVMAERKRIGEAAEAKRQMPTLDFGVSPLPTQ